MKIPKCVHPSESLKFIGIGHTKTGFYFKCVKCNLIKREVSLK